MGNIPVHAQNGAAFAAPYFSSRKFKFAKLVGPAYNRFVQGIAGIEVLNMEILHKAYKEFQQKHSRLILLFKHGAKADGPVVLQTVIKELKKWSKQNVSSLEEAPHTHFLYGKDVLNWAGFLARWMFPAIGGIPVVNGRMEKQSHSVIRNILTNGRFPVAFAPEGQVTYHTYKIFPFAAGTSKLAAWTHVDLRRENRKESVIVLPMAICYRYAKDVAKLTDDCIAALDGYTGLQTAAMADPRKSLLKTTEALLGSLEHAYATAYPGIVGFNRQTEPDKRITRLCDMILKCHEAIIGYEPRGEILERVFRVRYWVMDSLHRNDVDVNTLSPVERSLADHRAFIAKAAGEHQQIVDLLEYLQPDYIHDGCSATRIAEYAMNLLDLCNRIGGGDVDSRFLHKRMKAKVLFGEPINASEFFEGAAGSWRSKLDALDRHIKSIFESLVQQLEERFG